MTQVFIGLGSNLDNPLAQVKQAIASLAALQSVVIVAQSAWYESLPVGPEQPNYINGVVEITTTLEPEACLDALQAIENQQRRIRTVRWGPRTLDLDILLWGEQCIDTSRLVVPHPSMLERAFVLIPLFDIAPKLMLPDGSSLTSHTKHCDHTSLTRLS